MTRLFTVIEYSSFFAVRHNPSGEEHPMGDGVDTMFDEEGRALQPGSLGFVETWEDTLNADETSTLEASADPNWLLTRQGDQLGFVYGEMG